MDETSQIIKFPFLDVPAGATYFLALPILLVLVEEERWPGCFTRPPSAMRVPMDKSKSAGQFPPPLPADAITQHHFALAEPWATLGFCISSPALAAGGTPSCLWGHGCGQAGDAIACLPSGCVGWDCSRASQPSPPPEAEDWGLDKYIPLDLYINFCILSHLLALFFLKLHLLWVMIPPAVARP